MKEKNVSILSLVVLVIFGIATFVTAWYGQSVSWRFLLAFFPLLVILFGVAFLLTVATGILIGIFVNIGL